MPMDNPYQPPREERSPVTPPARDGSRFDRPATLVLRLAAILFVLLGGMLLFYQYLLIEMSDGSVQNEVWLAVMPLLATLFNLLLVAVFLRLKLSDRRTAAAWAALVAIISIIQFCSGAGWHPAAGTAVATFPAVIAACAARRVR
jgi:hypothetical protein